MSKRPPEHIDPWRLTEQGRQLAGEFALARFRRLHERGAEGEQPVRFALDFGLGEAGWRLVQGRIEAHFVLPCERCLAPLAMDFALDVCLGLVRAEAEAERLPPDCEPVLAGNEPLSLVALIEDELLLALPDFPRHADDLCVAGASTRSDDGTGDDARSAQPFAHLDELLKGRP